MVCNIVELCLLCVFRVISRICRISWSLDRMSPPADTKSSPKPNSTVNKIHSPNPFYR